MLKKRKREKSEAVKLQTRFEILRTVLAIAIAMGIVLVLVLFVSDEPLTAISSLLIGPFTSVKRFANVIELMIPLTFTGLAITIVFKTKRYNLAADSAFFMGSLIALVVALTTNLPPLPTIILALVASIVVGAIIGYIPAIIRSKFGADELVTSLMLNYVVGFLVNYIFNYHFRDPQKAAVQSYPLPEGMNLSVIIPGTRIHSGFIIMIVLVVVTWLVMYRTKWGYQLRATGANEKFAKYSGMKVGFIVIAAQAIGTAFAGLGGAIEMLGLHKTFKWTKAPGYGFDGVIMATLARGNPALVPFAAFFLAYVRVGADILNRTTSLPAEIVSIIQATIILLVAAQAFLAKMRHRSIVKQTGALEVGGEQ
ncbi:ABC transporter permease [Erysipelothrix sp. HDW6C]|uniref:ABC transporter permease n=1 Tax=Erysipelothrix sp. HDW6C TaxID=2714930 RepID=UPI001409FBD4|nr:ABC transporter permease [Erysipelothrix sp. HDW6C]QIK69632.1 ABC transporter permease [Erysipelothrix sp. HDW6C]